MRRKTCAYCGGVIKKNQPALRSSWTKSWYHAYPQHCLRRRKKTPPKG